MKIAELKDFSEKVFRSYFERCTRKKLDNLNDTQRLLLLEAQHSTDPLKFLYCHMQ
jgi:hypothetical protein